jgi:predicted LPLAT superfamily acyltransferase
MPSNESDETQRAPAAERHLPSFLAVAIRFTFWVVFALRSSQPRHLRFEQLADDGQADANRERQQALLGSTRQLA